MIHVYTVCVKVLFIEDYVPLQKAVAKAVRENGWAVDVAADGPDGRWHWENNDYDVVILDLMLPGVHGLELLKQARTRGDATPVIILTARDGVEDRVKGLDVGADDYLVKPFFISELLSRLNALVRRSYGQENPVIQVGSLAMDTSARTVSRGDREIDLTAREYALLEYFVRRAGQVVSRTDIWNHVYENYLGTGSNVVDVYVGYLRKKLHLSGMPELIHTRRGQGYVLQEK